MRDNCLMASRGRFIVVSNGNHCGSFAFICDHVCWFICCKTCLASLTPSMRPQGEHHPVDLIIFDFDETLPPGSGPRGTGGMRTWSWKELDERFFDEVDGLIVQLG